MLGSRDDVAAVYLFDLSRAEPHGPGATWTWPCSSTRRRRPANLATAVAILVVFGMLAALGPALRAMRVAPPPRCAASSRTRRGGLAPGRWSARTGAVVDGRPVSDPPGGSPRRSPTATALDITRTRKGCLPSGPGGAGKSDPGQREAAGHRGAVWARRVRLPVPPPTGILLAWLHPCERRSWIGRP